MKARICVVISAVGPLWFAACDAVEIPADLVSALQSQNFHEREAGDKKLAEWSRKRPEQAMDELLEQAQSAEDPEVRERCLGVLRQLVDDEYLANGDGYLGIQRQSIVAVSPGDGKPMNAVLVVQVVPDSAAQTAGLVPNDQILSLNGEGWSDERASDLFADKVKGTKPNTKVVLKVLRDGKILNIDVILGRRPLQADSLLFNAQGAELDTLERSAKEAYFRRWLSSRRRRAE